MANTSSAKKAIRVSAKKHAQNLITKKKMKEARKAVVKAVASNEKNKVAELISAAYKYIDKAAKKRVIHENTAARYKSALAAKVKALVK